jgi:hypothetical protein
MKSYEVLKDAVDKVGAKRVAGDVDVSTSLVYKWCEAAKKNPDDEKSGARNPLDRIVALMNSTGDKEIIAWMCEQAGGFFVENSEAQDGNSGIEYINRTHNLMQNFSELLQVMSDSIQNDGIIDSGEAKRIRREWQELKRHGESFVTACEKGVFNQPRKK